jgi:hypothetical protein
MSKENDPDKGKLRFADAIFFMALIAIFAGLFWQIHKAFQ